MEEPTKPANETPTETPVEASTETPAAEVMPAAEAAPAMPQALPAAEEAAPTPATSMPESAPAVTVPPVQPAATAAPAAANMNAATFVPGGNGPLPAELHGWNWGAFFLSWIWGIGHRTWISLLAFIPFANIVMPFVLGAKGNEWAWQNRPFASVEQFKQTQRAWTIWGAVMFGVSLLLAILFFGAIMAMVGVTAMSDSSYTDGTDYMTEEY